MSFKSFSKISFLLFAYFSSWQMAHAATPNQQAIGIINPGQVQNNLLENSQPPPRKLAPSITEEPAPTATIPQGEKIKLELTGVLIEGNTIFSTAELEAIFNPFLHKTISLADLQRLVDAVTKKYRDAGYILSQAILPPQRIKKNGPVKIEVIEGFISHVLIQGNPGLARVLLEKYSKPVLQSRPLKMSILERQLLLANDLPGLNVKAVITPSRTIPGSADLTLLATRKLLSSYLVYDNFGSRYLGPHQTSFGVTGNSLFTPGDSNALHFSTTSRTGELQFAEFVRTQPLGWKETTLLIGSNYTQTNPKFTLTSSDIIGRSFSVFSNLTYPYLRSRNQNLSFTGLMNYQNVTSTILGGPFYQDRLRSLGLSGSYDKIDHLSGFNTLRLSLEHGFNILGAAQHFYLSRPNGRSAFTRSNLSASRLQTLTQRFALYLGIDGQYAFNPLLVSEQFSFGGANWGRGYDPSEIVGDRGLAAKLEFRVQTTPSLRWLQNVQYYVFYDAGKIWNLDAINLPGEQSATSTGLGARLTFVPQITGEFFVAKPLTRKVTTLTLMNVNPNQARGFFQLVARL
jgi:hemolysin activation/secretion protein